MPTAGATRKWEPMETPLEDKKWPSTEEADAKNPCSTHIHPELEAEIEQAREMLKLENDWDGEGSQVYSEDTFERAVAFLTAHSEHLWNVFGLCAPVPRIGPGPKGSIDLHWKRESWELLVNIPANADSMAVFYGDNYGAQKIRGSVDPKTFNFGIANWLMS